MYFVCFGYNQILNSAAFVIDDSENHTRLMQLEDAAKAAGKGKWGPQDELAAHVRDIKWTIEGKPQHFVETQKGKEIDGKLYFTFAFSCEVESLKKIGWHFNIISYHVGFTVHQVFTIMSFSYLLFCLPSTVRRSQTNILL